MKKTVGVLIYFILAACYATYPLVVHISDALPHLGDELLITWILNWDIHAIFTNPLGIFHTNTFYPYQNTLAYSDMFLPSAVLGILPWFFFQEPATAYNVTLILSFALLGFCTYLLVVFLTKSHLPGIISGTVVAFSTYIITKTMHLQMVSTFWIPLSLLFFFRYTKTGNTRDMFFCFLFFFLQAANSFQPAYFLAASLVFFWIYFYFSDKKIFFSFLNKKVILLGMLTALCIGSIALPYFSVSKQFNYSRDIRDAIHLANRPEYTFYPSGRTRLQDSIIEILYKNDTHPFKYDGYIGFGFFALFFFSLIYYFTKIKKPILCFKPFVLLGAFGFIMSLGPAWQWGGGVIKLPFIIPLPYALFYYIVPGFNGMRNSARWELLFLFAISVAIGLFFSNLFKTTLKKWAVAITIFICIVVLGEIPIPMSIASVPTKEEIPKTYSFLKTLPQSAVLIEMPAYVWYMAPYATQELHREYYSTVDFKNRVNGGSGFSPIVWEKQISSLLAQFPNNWSIEKLQSLGVTHIVIHADEYDRLFTDKYKIENTPIPSFNTKKLQLDKEKRVKLIKIIGTDYIYQLQ